MFTMSPEAYLVDTMGVDVNTGRRVKFCLFGITPLSQYVGSNTQMFIFGDVFLRNYYSVFDMDQRTVSLAVDSIAHEKDIAGMRKSTNIIYMILVVTILPCLVIVLVVF